MPLENLPDGFTAPDRASVRDTFQRDYSLRQPGSPTGKGSQPHTDGSVIADALMPVYANNVSTARGASLRDMTRAQLMEEAGRIGIPQELPAGAGSGFVKITASAAGVFLPNTLLAKDEVRNLTFRVASSQTYFNEGAVPLVGVDAGPETNIPAGTRLKWQGGPPALGGIAVVIEDLNGDGFTGGRSEETEGDIVRRIEAARAEPPAAGNVSEIRKRVFEAGAVLGIPVQEVFVYPAVKGPGTYSYVFTLRPGVPGTSRIPNDTQIAQVRAYLHRSLPEDDGILAASIIESEVSVRLAVEWATNEGWVDAAPWPRAADDVYTSSVTSPIVMTLKTLNTTPQAPKVGDSFAFYNFATQKFLRKRIAAVTPVNLGVSGWEYVIAVESANNASDLTYTPLVNDRCCPWSPSLDLLSPPLLDEIDQLGAGEQVAEIEWFDEGERMKRHPFDPLVAPSAIRHKTFNAVEDLPQVRDLQVLSPSLPFACPDGVAGASSNILKVKSILAFQIP